MSDQASFLREDLRFTDDPGERFDTICELCRILGDRGEYSEALSIARELPDLAERLNDRRRRALALRIVGGLTEAAGDYGAALDLERRSFRAYSALGDSEGQASLHLNIGITLYRMGRLAEAIESFDAGCALARDLGASSLEANFLMSRARVWASIGEFARSIQGEIEALRIVEELGDEWLRGSLLVNIGCTYYESSKPEEAESWWLRALEESRRTGQLDVVQRVLTDLGILARERGSLDQSKERLREALEVARAVGNQMAVAAILGELGETLRRHGELDPARVYLLDAVRSAHDTGDTANELTSLLWLGQLHIDSLEYQAARDRLEAGLDISRTTGARSRQSEFHISLSRLHEIQGEIDPAFDHYRKGIELREEMLGSEQRQAIEEIRLGHQIETTVREREALSLENQRLSAEAEQRHRELTSMAMGLVRKNQALERLRDGIQRGAASVEGEARKGLRGLLPLIQEALGGEEEWGEFERRFAQVHPGFVDEISRRAPDLSPAELRVASLLRMQMNTKEIAALLCVTTRAVEKHRLSLRQKLRLDRQANLPTALAGVEGGMTMKDEG